jgi:hypothetical protein
LKKSKLSDTRGRKMLVPLERSELNDDQDLVALDERAREAGKDDGSLGVVPFEGLQLPFLDYLTSLGEVALAGVSEKRNAESGTLQREIGTLDAQIASITERRDAGSMGPITIDKLKKIDEARIESARRRIAELKALQSSIDEVHLDRANEVVKSFAALAASYWNAYFVARVTVMHRKNDLLRPKRWFGRWFFGWKKPDGVADFVGEELAVGLPKSSFTLPCLPVWTTKG